MRLLTLLLSVCLVSCFNPISKLEKRRNVLESKLAQLQEEEQSLNKKLVQIERDKRDLVEEAKIASSRLDADTVKTLSNLIIGGVSGKYDTGAAIDYVYGENERNHLIQTFLNKANDLDKDHQAINKQLKALNIEVKKTQVFIRQVKKEIKLRSVQK